MINKIELINISDVRGLRAQVVEKNYIIGWVLAGIYQHESLKNAWIFKGGTCLKKCHYETYRFSEDLDFSVTDPSHLNEKFLVQTFTEICDWLFIQSGIAFPEHLLQFRIFKNSLGSESCQGKLAYRGPVGPSTGYRSLPRLKIDLTFDEKVVLKPVFRNVCHEYSDGLSERSALCYPIEEAAAEKICALTQRSNPRDLYDLINLLRSDEVHTDVELLQYVLKNKCAHRSIPVPTLQSVMAQKSKFEQIWPHMLSHQLPQLPPVASYLEALPELFDWIEHGTTVSLMPIDTNNPTLRQQSIDIQIDSNIQKYLESIRFAAVNHLCVDLYYQQSIHRIEPYSMGSTTSSEIILHAINVSSGKHITFRSSKIQNVTITQQIFQPKYCVELRPLLRSQDA